jgi:predicted ATP-grasp superfamily ATP-dependent carboligase
MSLARLAAEQAESVMARILLVGNLRSSLTIARNLSRAGHEVHCGVDDLDPFLFTSRHIKGVLWHPRTDTEAQASLSVIADYVQAHGIDAVYPVSDVVVRLISRNRGRFPAHVRVIVADERVVEACVDKVGMFQLCERLGVPIAPLRLVHDYPALEAAVAEIGRPCVIKPIGNSRYLADAKALVVRAAWPGEHETLCVQAFAAGVRHDVDFAAHNGRLIGAVQVEARRTDRFDGTGHMIEKVSVAPMAEVVRAVETLVEALDYTGVGNVQFMVDQQTGRVSYLENNPRMAAGFRSAVVCGLPLAVMNFQFWGERNPPTPRADPWSYPIGKRMVWTKGDISGFLHELKAGALTPKQAAGWAFALVRNLFAPDHLTFSLTDPVPSFWIYLQAPLKKLGIAPGSKRLARARSSRLHALEPWPTTGAA